MRWKYVLHDVYETIEKAVILMMPFCSFSGGTEALFTLLGSLVTFVGILLNAGSPWLITTDPTLHEALSEWRHNLGLDEIHQFMGIPV